MCKIMTISVTVVCSNLVQSKSGKESISTTRVSQNNLCLFSLSWYDIERRERKGINDSSLCVFFFRLWLIIFRTFPKCTHWQCTLQLERSISLKAPLPPLPLDPGGVSVSVCFVSSLVPVRSLLSSVYSGNQLMILHQFLTYCWPTHSLFP